MRDSEFDARLTTLVAAHPTEAEFAALCELFRVASPAQRSRLCHAVPPTFGTWALPDRYSLAAGDVPNSVAERRLRDLLTWHAVAPSLDFRDDLVALAPLYHSTVRLGLDARALFDEVAATAATPGAAALIRDFPRRHPEDRSLAAFLLREVSTPEGGVRYVQER
jgi:hypothetical protein